MFSERESIAVYFLRERNLDRSGVVGVVSAARGETGE
jgi:hypothetical protein